MTVSLLHYAMMCLFCLTTTKGLSESDSWNYIGEFLWIIGHVSWEFTTTTKLWLFCYATPKECFHQNNVTVVCSSAHANIFSPILQEADVKERVAAQLEALITASGWEIGGVCSDPEAAAVSSRAAPSSKA